MKKQKKKARQGPLETDNLPFARILSATFRINPEVLTTGNPKSTYSKPIVCAAGSGSQFKE